MNRELAIELSDAVAALESAQTDIDDCENRIDDAGNELSNLRSNVEDAMAAIEGIEVADDKTEELERFLKEAHAIIALRDDRIARLTEALDEVQTIALDATI